MTKILFISSHFPSTLGGVRRLYNNMLAFSKQFEVHFIQVDLGDSYTKGKIDLPSWIKYNIINPKGKKLDLLALLMPLQAKRICIIESTVPEIQTYIDANKIDAVLIHGPDMSFALRRLNTKIKVAEILDHVPNYYKTKLIAEPSLKSRILKIVMSPLYSLAEKVIEKDFNLFAFVSKIDLNESSIDHKKKIFGEVRDYPLPQSINRIRGNDVILFGRWTHPPNRDGLARILPYLKNINGKVILIGPDIPKDADIPDNVHIRGFVDDIAFTMENSKICLIPVWYGAGLQNKAFDALKYGCKVVSTDFTKHTMEMNGFHSDSIVASIDLIKDTNTALYEYSGKTASDAYKAYKQFYDISSSKTEEYVKRVRSLCDKT